LERPKQILAGLVSAVIAVFITGPVIYFLVWITGGNSFITNNLFFLTAGVFLIAWWAVFLKIIAT